MRYGLTQPVKLNSHDKRTSGRPTAEFSLVSILRRLSATLLSIIIEGENDFRETKFFTHEWHRRTMHGTRQNKKTRFKYLVQKLVQILPLVSLFQNYDNECTFKTFCMRIFARKTFLRLRCSSIHVKMRVLLRFSAGN